MFTYKTFDFPSVDADVQKGIDLFDLSIDLTPELELAPFEIDVDSLVFEPVSSNWTSSGSASASGAGFASVGFSGSASGSGFSSISASASSYVGPDGQSFSSITASATGDNVSGSGFAAAGDSFDSFDFGSWSFEPLALEPIDLSGFSFDGLL